MSEIFERIEGARPYWDAFWRGDVPMLSAVVPKDPTKPVSKPPNGIYRATDIDALANALLEWVDANDFLGGAIPFYCVYFKGYLQPAGGVSCRRGYIGRRRLP